jgi:RsiW-degrading membrane proteinase PrsW (M82 family)
MFLVAVAIAPGLFWLWYFLRRDALRPEPRHLIVRMFFLGGVAGIGAAVLEHAALRALVLALDGGRHRDALVSAALIGLIEEGAKFAAVFYGVYRRVEFDEVIDGIIYAVAASMGFGTLENIAYVLDGGLGVGVLRAVLSVPGHAFFAAVMGYNIGRAKFADRREWEWLAGGVLAAALAHALYDAVILTRTALALAVVPIVAVLWRRSLAQIRHALFLDEDPSRRA